MTDEERREMTRRNYAAQMEMIGYDASGNALDMVRVVRCKDCKWRPHKEGKDLIFPKIDEIYMGRCPCQCDDSYYSWMPDDNWFCGNGER